MSEWFKRVKDFVTKRTGYEFMGVDIGLAGKRALVAAIPVSILFGLSLFWSFALSALVSAGVQTLFGGSKTHSPKFG